MCTVVQRHFTEHEYAYTFSFQPYLKDETHAERKQSEFVLERNIPTRK